MGSGIKILPIKKTLDPDSLPSPVQSTFKKLGQSYTNSFREFKKAQSPQLSL